MLPAVPGKERPDFVRRVFATLMEHGTTGLSDEEFDDLKGRLLEILDGTEPTGAAPSPAAGGG